MDFQLPHSPGIFSIIAGYIKNQYLYLTCEVIWKPIVFFAVIGIESILPEIQLQDLLSSEMEDKNASLDTLKICKMLNISS